MDIISHGLYGGIAFGRKNKKMFWWSFFFGVMPDLLVFGPFFVQRIFSAIFNGTSPFAFGRPESMTIPNYVYQGYDITHSIVVFLVVFGLVWLFMKKPPLVILGWPLHILVDLFTHTPEFFPTPIFWPISGAHFSHGISWGTPFIFIPNVILLVVLYTYFLLIRPRQRKGIVWDESNEVKK